MLNVVVLGGAFYATRMCGIDAEWSEPMWLSSCETTLEVMWLNLMLINK